MRGCAACCDKGLVRIVLGDFVSLYEGIVWDFDSLYGGLGSIFDSLYGCGVDI
jgi:hypothetical protein